MAADSDEDELFTFAAPKSPTTSRKRSSIDDGEELYIMDSDEDDPPRRRTTVIADGSKGASLLRNLQCSSGSKDEVSPKKPKNTPSSADNEQVLNLDDSDSDDLDNNWSPSPCKYSHAASSIVRDSRALLESMRQRNRGVAHVSNSSFSLDETPSPSSMSKSMTLRIRIGSSTERFSVGVTEPFSSILERVADKLQVEPKSILLTHQNQTITNRDTPESLNINTTDFIDGVVVDGIKDDEEDDGSDTEGILVRVQSEKHTELYKTTKSGPLGKIMQKFAEKIGISVEKIKFHFDGDKVLPSQTAEDLGMEDEDTIDATI